MKRGARFACEPTVENRKAGGRAGDVRDRFEAVSRRADQRPPPASGVSNATADALTVILVDFADAPLSGYRWKAEYIERRANEIEDALHCRAITTIPLEPW